jgi:hypothetical protein
LFCHLYLRYDPRAIAIAEILVSTYFFVVASVVLDGVVVIVKVVNFPVPGVEYPIFTLLIAPVVAGLILNVPVLDKLTAVVLVAVILVDVVVVAVNARIVEVSAVRSVNAPVDAVVLPIAILFNDPVVPEVMLTAPVEETVNVPFVIDVLPSTSNCERVPTRIKLLYRYMLGSVPDDVEIDTPFILNAPVMLTLPKVSTLNPGLENPESERKGF